MDFVSFASKFKDLMGSRRENPRSLSRAYEELTHEKLSEGTIRSYMKGATLPQINTFANLCLVLGVRFDYFFESAILCHQLHTQDEFDSLHREIQALQDKLMEAKAWINLLERQLDRERERRDDRIERQLKRILENQSRAGERADTPEDNGLPPPYP